MNEEFQESEMWDIIMEERVCKKPEKSSIGPLSRQLPSAVAMLIPRVKKNPGPDPNLVQHSAPVNIRPMGNSSSYEDDSDGDDDVEGRRVVPPHEWLAKKQTSSLSVCEGAGRTLKGRDLRRVRHAVLTKTGFI